MDGIATEARAFVKDDVALHVTLGHAGKNSNAPSVSTQVAILRRLLRESDDGSEWARVASGELLLAVHVDSKVSEPPITRM
jgi:hypothetical protein